VTAIFAVLAPSAWAVPPAVTNCLDDNSGGTLREAVLGATSGDVIDLSALACGTITLSTGAITISTLQTLTLHGPGLYDLAIIDKGADRVFKHDHPDSHLYIDNLRVGYGSYTASGNPASGGCIYSSQGTVTLTNVGVYYCSTTTTGTSDMTMPAPVAAGGGVAAVGGLTISGSILYKNTVSASNAEVQALGGCAATPGTFDMRDSTVAYCQAIGPPGSSKVQGGALALGGNVTITGSIVGKSSSSWTAGAIFIASADPAAVTATISNSTITSNHAGAAVGGLFTNLGQVNINNSTIVLNTAPGFATPAPTHYYAPGVAIISKSGPVALSLQSTIIANNSSGGVQEDLSTGLSPAAVTITGSNNLVRSYKSDVTLPGGQGNLTGVCPLLGPIRNNGGLTPTHALLSHSPAIDAGNNNAIDPHSPPPGAPASYDGRGPGFARESGAADIGAYELQKSEIVFDASFDGCP
jgi:hypothetical protein